MAIANPKRLTYTRSVSAGTAATFVIATPPNVNAFRVVDINASVTTLYSGGTGAQIGVGVTNNLNAAGVVTLGAAQAANTAIGLGSQYVKSSSPNVAGNPLVGLIDLTGTAAAAAVTAPYPAALEVNGNLIITYTPNAAVAGAAVVDVTVDWL
jgi:hypothetical protein